MCEHYPDTESRELIREIALFETGVTGKKVPGDMIVCGNGAADILYRTMALLKPSKVLLPVPSFSEYEKAVKEIGGEIKYYYRRIENDYRVDERILESIEDVDMVIMCNPNNPTGDVTDAELMERIVAECERCRVKLIVDECFMDFADEGLRYCAGDRAFYRETLEDYVSSGLQKLTKLEKLKQNRNWVEYRILVHAMKSNAKMIGASSLADLAAGLEEAASKGQEEKIENQHGKFVEMTKSISERIRQVL